MSKAEGSDDSAVLSPLLRRDPPAVGTIRLIGRLSSHDAGMTYAGHPQAPKSVPSPEDESAAHRSDDLAPGGDRVSPDMQITVVMLTSGAETDSYARARFRAAIAELESNNAKAVLAREDEEDLAPWVALDAASWTDGRDVGDRLLQAVTLEDQTPVGMVHGPQFRPHWWQRVNVGRWRLWPLPWPARLSSVGRWTFLASFAVICALAALALWIAVLVFRNQPPPAPTPGPGPGPNPPSTSPTSPPREPQGPIPTQGGPTGRTIPPIV